MFRQNQDVRGLHVAFAQRVFNTTEEFLLTVYSQIFIFRDKDAISSKCPVAYIEHEREQVRRNSSVVSANPKALEAMRQRAAQANEGISDEEKETGGYTHEEKV